MLHFFPSFYNSKEVLIRSTPVPRTEESVQNLLQGLFPETNKNEKIEAVIHLPKDETMWPDDVGCERLADLRKNFHQSDRFLKNVKDDREILEESLEPILQLKDKNGKEPSRRNWHLQLFDIFHCLGSDIEKLPPIHRELAKKNIDRLEELLVMHYWNAFEDPEMCRLSIGRFLKEIVDNVQKKANAKSDLKVIIYSAHDTTVAPLLAALKVFDHKCPPLASHIELELFQNKKDKEHVVRVIYNDKVIPLPIQSKLGNTNFVEFLSLKNFVELTTPMIPTNYEGECKRK